MVAPDSVWEIVFLMVILKIPIAYLCFVIWYAVKAEPKPEEGAGNTAELGPDDGGQGGLRRRTPAAAAPARSPRWPVPLLSARAAYRRRVRLEKATMSDVSAETHVDEAQPARSRASAEVVAGYLAALSIFASVIALAWHPLRIVIPAVILALVAAGDGRPREPARPRSRRDRGAGVLPRDGDRRRRVTPAVLRRRRCYKGSV